MGRYRFHLTSLTNSWMELQYLDNAEELITVSHFKKATVIEQIKFINKIVIYLSLYVLLSQICL